MQLLRLAAADRGISAERAGDPVLAGRSPAIETGSSGKDGRLGLSVADGGRLTGAMLNRLTRRCHILYANGESYCLRGAKCRRTKGSSGGPMQTKLARATRSPEPVTTLARGQLIKIPLSFSPRATFSDGRLQRVGRRFQFDSSRWRIDLQSGFVIG